MTTLASLRTRLQYRLGVTVASSAEEALDDESLNAAIAWTAAKGAPQLRQVYSGYTLASASPTITHSANASTATLSNANGVYPGDILINATTGKSYLIRTVSGTTIDLGIPIVSSMTGNTVTVTRRSMPLPHAGTIWSVWQDAGSELKNDPLVASRSPFTTGTPTTYTQTWAAEGGVSLLTLYPAPTTSTQYIITQGPNFAKDADIFASESLLTEILGKAHEFRLLMSSQGGQAQLAGIMSTALEVLRQTGSPNAVFTR